MLPKTRKELRERFIDPLYDFVSNHKEEWLGFEASQLNEALKCLVIADCHLAHLQMSHTEAKEKRSLICRQLESIS